MHNQKLFNSTHGGLMSAACKALGWLGIAIAALSFEAIAAETGDIAAVPESTNSVVRDVVNPILKSATSGRQGVTDTHDQEGVENSAAFGAPDTDGDGVADDTDNCTLIPNPLQIDSDDDGIGNWCDPDIDNNCIVGFIDISSFPPRFNSAVGDPTYSEVHDFDSSGSINFLDYQIMTLYFNGPPGPSANPCGLGLGAF